jgi:hypothetical protein
LFNSLLGVTAHLVIEMSDGFELQGRVLDIEVTG